MVPLLCRSSRLALLLTLASLSPAGAHALGASLGGPSGGEPGSGDLETRLERITLALQERNRPSPDASTGIAAPGADDLLARGFGNGRYRRFANGRRGSAYRGPYRRFANGHGYYGGRRRFVNGRGGYYPRSFINRGVVRPRFVNW